VAYLRNLVRIRPVGWTGWGLAPLRLAVAGLALPVLLGALLLGHAGIALELGSTDDPLGYTVEITK